MNTADPLDTLYDAIEAELRNHDIPPRDRDAMVAVVTEQVDRYSVLASRGVVEPLARPDDTIAEIISDIYDYGVLGELFELEGVEDITVHGGQVRYFRHGQWHAPSRPTTERWNRHAVMQLLREAGVPLNQERPIVDRVQVLGGKGRLAGSIPPVSPVLDVTIRLYVVRSVTMEDLVEWDMLSQEAADLLSLTLRTRGAIIISGQVGAGKFQPTDEPVLTPGGWVPIGELRPGDEVIGGDGKPTVVEAVFPQGLQPVARVTFNDGSCTRAGWPHLWQSRTNWCTYRQSSWSVVTTQQMSEPIQKDWQIPLVEPIHASPIALPVPPYMLGVLLGDGTLGCSGTFSLCTDRVIVDSLGLDVVHYSHPSPGITQARIRDAALQATLQSLALWGCRSWEKHVPPMYLLGHPEDRLALLQGLLDTDGTPTRHGGAEFSSTSPALVDAVIELVRSLGGISRTRRAASAMYRDKNGERKQGRPAERVYLKLPAGITPFRLSRKAERYVAPTKYPPTRVVRSVEADGEAECVCIKVAAPDGLYVTRHHIVTHNTTVMSGLLAQVDVGMRPLLVEDYREITLDHDLGGSFQIVPGPADGRPERSIAGLVRFILGMHLDLAAVGEVRGKEAWDLPSTAGLGAGFVCTVHGSDATRALERLARLSRGHDDRPDMELVRETFSNLIHFVVHCQRGMGAGGEYLHQVTEIRALGPPVDAGRGFSHIAIFDRPDGLGTPMRWTKMEPPVPVTEQLESLLPTGVSLRDVLGGTA